ncbi:MAG: ferredoxin--NADP reductase, partial [Armatimonadota bacterium]|nr:ferredoxin--NADP reductase [Armatimonadota bacterium]
MEQPTLNATISDRIDLGPELMIIRVVPDGWPVPDFKAGQFAVLGLPGATPRYWLAAPDPRHPDPHKYILRAYSIASTPQNRTFMEFYITLVRTGALTPRLWLPRMGDMIYLSPKIAGKFTMESVPEEKNVIFIATGTGIAPFISMLQTYLSPAMTRRFVLFHGVRQSQDLAYRSELLTMERLCPNFRYFPIISREQDDPVPWYGPIGRVQQLWQSGVVENAWGVRPAPANAHVFLCGHPEMIREMSALLQ